jgi:PsbP
MLLCVSLAAVRALLTVVVLPFALHCTTQTSRLYLHNICVIAARGDELYTLTVLAPEKEWTSKSEKLQKVADSFRLTR